jgi:hypothetical protein
MTPTGACPAEESTRMWLAPVRPPHMTTMKRRNGAPGEVAVEQILPVKPDLTSHTKGVTQGNSMGSYEKQPGHFPDGRSNSTRSTGISPGIVNPIHPDMPNLSPP